MLYLRPGTLEGTGATTLESKDGKVRAGHDFAQVKPANSCQMLTTTLTATGTDPQARLVLSFRGKGDLQVDWVSLFPPTYKNRPNGLRPDLAKYLEDLKPAFIRYPGGCYVEGLSWESAPDWRKMVCPPEQRPGQWGYWQYRSTDGFGYHEFLQFCEDIGSKALYVAPCGMTVHPENNMPLDQIDPVIQQTLDAIEYALGPVGSKWGAARAKMGHPQPFPLRYVEIGNEHPPAVYADYYVRFRQAIHAKYPDITVIMSMFWSGLNPAAISRAGDANIDMVDEHAYSDASWIRTNFDHFDKYPRKNWSIYVGEYASHHGGGDWYGGMGDSLYLMMCERNGDLVKMASYAPLLVNVNKPDWGINLIEFDSARSYAHASYYVQKLLKTGARPFHYRAMIFLGEILYSATNESFISDPSPTTDIKTLLKISVASNNPGNRERNIVIDERKNNFALKVAKAFSKYPILGIDIIEDVETKKLYVLEVNAGGNGWHFSSAIAADLPDHTEAQNIQMLEQYKAFDTAAKALVRKTHELAS